MEKLQIAQMLYAQRVSKKKTQTQAGNVLGVTFQQFQKYEKGANGIPSAKLMKFCNHYKLNVSEFQNGDPYGVIQSSDIHPAVKEKHYINLNELETKINREQKYDKDRSHKDMVGQSLNPRTYL